jgi:hypothetical protein
MQLLQWRGEKIMDQNGNQCRCFCHATFTCKEPEWKCWCFCKVGDTVPFIVPPKYDTTDWKALYYQSKSLMSEVEDWKAKYEKVKGMIIRLVKEINTVNDYNLKQPIDKVRGLMMIYKFDQDICDFLKKEKKDGQV